jgi:O-antigen/teichoic acid export membrane protein
MNRKEQLVSVKNAIANVARGSSAAVVAVILPPFLTRAMSIDAYGAWSLVLQISAYAGYLDFGIQTAVGRFVAYANERRNAGQRDSVVSTSLVALSLAGIVALLGGAAVSILLPRMFRQMPLTLMRDTRIALVLVVGSLAVGLPASVFSGIFVGLQRYEIPAAIIGGGRVLNAILIILVVKHGGNLATMGLAVAALNLVSYCLQYLMCRKLAPTVRLSWRLVSGKTARRIFDYCISLSVWSFVMLLVTGLDIIIVGYFQFDAVAYYAVAATLITFLAGLLNAVFSVMIPSTAVQHARGESKELGNAMLTATRYGSFLLLIIGLPLVLAAKGILSSWVGSAYAFHGTRILQVLVAANMLRLSSIPYAMSLIGTGQQRLVIITPLIEGFSNLLASVVGGYLYGAVGVAIGTLIGSIVAVSVNLLYNMPRTSGIEFRISEYLRDGYLRPAICTLPLIACAAVFRWDTPSTPLAVYLGSTVALVATAFLVWRCGLVGSERAKLRMVRFAIQP